MANLNIWKTVYQRNIKVFNKYYPNFSYLEDIEKSRYGLYLFILETMFDIENKQELEGHIFDTKFNKEILKFNGNDNKVDCIYIDDEKKKIYIMNFKYRGKYKENRSFKSTEVDATINFLTMINDDEFNSDELHNSKLKVYFENIREIINDTSQIYDIYFYFISNEDKSFPPEIQQRIKTLERDKGIKIEQVSLDNIYEIGNKKSEPTCAKLLVEMDKLSLFKNDSYTTNNSYIMNISLFELLRMTCDNSNYRDSTDLKSREEFDLTTFAQEKSQLRDNVRSFLGFTDYNKNIKKTLQNDASNFFYYNNGITIVCNQITVTEAKSNRLYSIELKDIQIVNGGQTISTLFKIIEEKEVEDLLYKLKNTYILVRLFNIANNNELRLNIAQYTNSQNSIDKIDLKSVDKVQIEIEEYLKSFNIEYIRKRGTISEKVNSIKMITLAQLIYSFKGYPDRASNQKKRLFDEYYEYIFMNDFDVESCKTIYDLYNKILNYFEQNKKKYEISEIYYILYLFSKKFANFVDLSSKGIDDINDLIIQKISLFINEEAKKFTEKNENKFAVSRAYIKKGFKEQITKDYEEIFNKK